jgi:hypothetical protein
MIDDQYGLKQKTDSELHNWIIEHKPGTDEHVAGIHESMRRIAIMEEVIEKNEAPSRRRELIAIGIAIIAIAIAIIAVVTSYQ